LRLHGLGTLLANHQRKRKEAPTRKGTQSLSVVSPNMKIVEEKFEACLMESTKMAVSDSFKNALHKTSNKRFLYKLFDLAENSRPRARAAILKKASKEQMKMLIKLIHYIMNGEIRLQKDDQLRLNYLSEHFHHRASLKKTLESPFPEQVSLLSKITVYKQLFRNLFTLPENGS
jgi:hypothetical protein